MSESSYLDYARQLAAKGDFAAAEEALRVLLRTHHSRSAATVALADILFRQGKTGDAVDLLRASLADRACGDRLRDHLVGERLNDQALALIAGRADDRGPSGCIDRAIQAQLTGNLNGALAACNQALTLAPEDARAFNQLGRVLFNLRQPPQALQAFERAVKLAPDYAEAWHNLGHVLRAMNQFDRSEQAYQRSRELSPAYRSALLNLGIVRLARGRNEEALEPLAELCRIDPNHAEGWLNQGIALHVLRRLEEARACYLRAVELDPGNLAAHRHLGGLCNELIDTEGAMRHFRDALALSPRDPDLLAEIASLLERANRLEEARQTVDYGLKSSPADPGLSFEAAKLDRRAGAGADGLRKLRSLDFKRLHPRLHAPYWFELGTALDRAGEAAEAYAAFVKGNELVSRSLRARMTDAGAFDRHMDAVTRWLTRGAPVPAFEAGEDLGEDLCFLLGFPRSGTTLLDVMLDGHPQVSAIEERPTFEHVAFAVDQRHGGYPDGLQSTSRADRDALRRQYREIAAREGARFGAGRVVVDKMPIRTVHACFMHRLFPKAKFLFALRHPCDVVLSNFMQQFAINEVFLHFGTLPESVRVYDRVMNIWRLTLATMAVPVHYVRYESLVADTEGTLREACAFLGLPWVEGLSAHQANLAERGRIKTNSYHQVAEPVYQRALGRWQGYRPQFAPHLATLAPHARFFGYELG